MDLKLIIVCFITLIILFCGFDYKGKLSLILLAIVMIWMMGGRTYTVDLVNYMKFYRQARFADGIFSTDVGFGFLMFLGQKMGLGYFVFQTAYAALGIFLLAFVLKKYTNHPAISLSLFFIFFFPTITVQLRSLMAETLQLMAMLIFINSSKEHEIKPFFVILAALLFHNVSLFFLGMLVLLQFKKKSFVYVMVLGVIIAIPLLIELLEYLPAFIIRNKLGVYLSKARVDISAKAILFVCAYLGTTVIIWLLSQSKYMCTKAKAFKAKLDKLFVINVIGLIACALILLFSSNFYRMCRIILFLDLTYLVEWFFERGVLQKKLAPVLGGAVTVLFLILDTIKHTWSNIISLNIIFR